MRLESLEARVLLAADEPWEFVATAVPDPTADVLSLAGDNVAATFQTGVWLESDGAPAPPPGKSLDDPLRGAAVVVVERPFLTGVLKITEFSKFAQRIQIDAPRKGSPDVLTPYLKATTVYGYEDHGDYVVVYPDQEVRGQPRASIEYHFDGREHSVRYLGTTQKYVQERLHLVSEPALSLTSRGVFTELYEVSGGAERLFQRSDDVYDDLGRKFTTRTSHFASNGDNVVLEVNPIEGGSAGVNLAGEHHEFAFAGRVQADKQLQWDQNTYFLRGARGAFRGSSGDTEFARLTLDPHSIKLETAPEVSPLAIQPFGAGSLQVFEFRTLAFDRPEKRVRILAPTPYHGRLEQLLLLEKVSSYEVDDQGELVVRTAPDLRKVSHTFSPVGAYTRAELKGTTQKIEVRELMVDAAGASLQLTRERWAEELGGAMTLLQDRTLTRDAQGDLSQETYLRYVGADERLIWTHNVYDRVRPVWLAYVSQSRAETLELVSITNVQFDGFGRLESFEAVQRYEPDLLQRMIEFHMDETGLQVGFRLDPRPMYLRREFGDGELLIEQRPNYDRFVYLVDAQGSVLFERKLDSFSINDEYVLVEYDGEVSFIRPDGTLAAVTLVPFGDSRIEVRDTLGLERTEGGSRLETLERSWHLEDRELQKETYEYAADGSLLAARLSRNPLEWLKGDESPLATFTLDTRASERAATLFLSYTRTGQLRDLGVRQVVFPGLPELVRDAAGLVQTVRGEESALDGTARFWQLEFAAEGTRLNERVLFENRFGTASDERLGQISVVERFDPQGPARLLVRYSGQPVVANRAAWHPFDLFFAAQPLVEYEISDWTATGDRLVVTRVDGSRLTVSADETSVIFDSEQTWDSPWGVLTTRTSVRPTYNFGAGEGLLLLPFHQEIVAADGSVLQSERANYLMPLLGAPAVGSRSLVWRLTDGRTVEYRQQADVHLLAVTAPDGSNAVKRSRLLSSPQIDRWAETGLATRISGQIAGPGGPQDISLELFG